MATPRGKSVHFNVQTPFRSPTFRFRHGHGPQTPRAAATPRGTAATPGRRQAPADPEGVKVCVKQRPQNDEEGELLPLSVVALPDGSPAVQTAGEAVYPFDAVFVSEPGPAGSPGPDVQDRVTAWLLAETSRAVKSGQDMTVIKYGQTNSGKTTSSESFVAGLWTAVFGDGAAGEAEVTALELYGEKLADLLSADPSAHKMMGTEAADQLLANLTRESAASAADFAALHARVSALRVSRPTQRSPLSSRSHLIFRVRIGISLVTLVDLAGSEAPALAADQEAFAEATRINSSLLALGMCVEERRKGGFVLYRRHALTRLLEAGLTRGQLRIVACVSPFLRDQRDTQRTLAFGTKARQLKMAPELPVAVDDEEDLRVMVESQRSRIEELDRELETRRSRTEELEKELAELRSLLPAATPSASQDAGVASGTQQADNDEASGGLCTDLQVADLESASTSAEHSAAAMVDANVQELAFEEPAMAAELELASPEDSSTEPTPARAELPIPVDAGDDWMDEPTFDPSDVSRFVSRRDVNGLCAAFASLPDRTRADLVRTLASEAVRWKEQAEKLRYNLNVAETRGVLGLHGEVPRRRTEPRPRAPEVPAQTGKEDSRERVPGRGKENVEPMAPLQAIAPDLGLRALVSGTIAEARSRRARVRDAA